MFVSKGKEVELERVGGDALQQTHAVVLARVGQVGEEDEPVGFFEQEVPLYRGKLGFPFVARGSEMFDPGTAFVCVDEVYVLEGRFQRAAVFVAGMQGNRGQVLGGSGGEFFLGVVRIWMMATTTTCARRGMCLPMRVLVCVCVSAVGRVAVERNVFHVDFAVLDRFDKRGGSVFDAAKGERCVQLNARQGVGLLVAHGKGVRVGGRVPPIYRPRIVNGRLVRGGADAGVAPSPSAAACLGRRG